MTFGSADSAASRPTGIPSTNSVASVASGVPSSGERAHRGQPIAALERGVGLAAPERAQGVDGEAGRGEIGAQSFDQREVHGSI